MDKTFDILSGVEESVGCIDGIRATKKDIKGL
jgi:hypothetical protein